MVHIGLELLKRAEKKVEKNNVKSIGLYLVKIFNAVDAEGEVTEFNKDKVVIKVNSCPYPFDSDEICMAHTEMEKTLVEQLNPDLRYRIGKSIPAGDDYCEHIIEYKNKE